ncbi:oxidoreductase [Aurantibacter crassamenti]|uniref:WD40/YVTN/BNR-like repeat-containing protein n=1 Tax=Aurantibacter crassamenti TaxID=1837375 RepID=UPI00193A9A56|nr:oxidoreductase [Aurantibacter crassamenti]MBM1107613.1 oxidoreductase [Aurantibacter crassamenti]
MTRFFILMILVLGSSCAKKNQKAPFTSVAIENLYEDSLSIRAIDLMGNNLVFAANKGVFGTIGLSSGKVRASVQTFGSIVPEYRAVAHNATDFFMLSVANPALLYKTGEDDVMDLVYDETGEKVFYDAMTFWNNREGIAVGDFMYGCLSIIITRDGGHHWAKLTCDELPQALEGEGAFAASNTNIVVKGNKTWIATTSSRVYFSPDKGKTWEIQETPIVKEEPTQGIYSMDFYNENIGIVVGGDYTKPNENKQNKAITKNGGKTWKLIADGQAPNYKSCVQFVPNSKGNGIVALGFTGISYSNDMGEHWKTLSDESFYTLRFLNDSVAYAAGQNRISKLIFR